MNAKKIIIFLFFIMNLLFNTFHAALITTMCKNGRAFQFFFGLLKQTDSLTMWWCVNKTMTDNYTCEGLSVNEVASVFNIVLDWYHT